MGFVVLCGQPCHCLEFLFKGLSGFILAKPIGWDTMFQAYHHKLQDELYISRRNPQAQPGMQGTDIQVAAHPRLQA